MKITSFNPIIITNNAEAALKLYEELGFTVKHHPVIENSNYGKVERYVLENKDGFRVDICPTVAVGDVKPEKDIVALRVNVDNFEEAVELLTSKGFKMLSQQTEVFECESFTAASYVSPGGTMINLIKHKKDRK